MTQAGTPEAATWREWASNYRWVVASFCFGPVVIIIGIILMAVGESPSDYLTSIASPFDFETMGSICKVQKVDWRSVTQPGSQNCYDVYT
jgi:hypothetical protein